MAQQWLAAGPFNASTASEAATNLAFKQWGTVFPGAPCVVALVDRFAQHCHRVAIDPDSWRDVHAFERDHPPTANKPGRRKRR